ncbi:MULTISPECIES: hypothetical protein [Variovorax]|uniref:hypothetical protein n=1 Tax=Variovorax TaxID=34072 RepID=UPI00339A48D1
MGSYSEMYFSDVKTPPGRGELSEASPYLLARHHVPILWLALFHTGDIFDVPAPDDPDDLYGPWPYMVAQRTRAIATLAARRALLSSRFQDMDPVWLIQFGLMLEQASFEYVHLDTASVGSMIGTGPEWRQSLETLLCIFEADPSLERQGWHLFNTHYVGAYRGEASKKPWTYCGSSGTNQPMPWEPPESGAART